MARSLRLFSVRGIDIRLHFTFPLILIWAALQFGANGAGVTGAVFGVVTVLLLFALVTLHELGHSFAALHYDMPVKQIVLSPIGGMAQLKRLPARPIQELVIAVAGPAVNVVIALAMVLLALLPGIRFANPLALLPWHVAADVDRHSRVGQQEKTESNGGRGQSGQARRRSQQFRHLQSCQSAHAAGAPSG